MFTRAGIPENLYLQYEHEPKFKISRQLLAQLENQGDEGFLLQQRLVTELCRLRDLPDREVPDRDGGLEALRRLKAVARDNDLAVEEERLVAQRRVADSSRLKSICAKRPRPSKSRQINENQDCLTDYLAA